MDTKQDVKYYFFSFSNFIAALGGGMILGKGVNVIDNPFLQGSSILAFFVGTVLGLTFLQVIPKNISTMLARWFSILAAITALILLYIFNTYALHEKLSSIPAIAFFSLLSIRFAFWFYSRVLRASLTAGQQQKIAWVELGYYSGMIFGLIIWHFLGIEIGMASALIIDACLQLSAGIIDLRVGNSSSPTSKSVTASNVEKIIKAKNIWNWQLAVSIVFLTIGIQVIIFTLAHQVSAHFTPFVLAFYYLGASLGAVFCKKFKILLEWHTIYPKIFLERKINNVSISFMLNAILASAFVGFAVHGVFHWQWGINLENTEPTFGHGETLLLLFIIASAFFYEILALAILDRIGLEEQGSNRNILMRTYGLMGIGAAVSLWLLGISNSSSIGLFFTLFTCVILSILFTRRKQVKFI